MPSYAFHDPLNLTTNSTLAFDQINRQGTNSEAIDTPFANIIAFRAGSCISIGPVHIPIVPPRSCERYYTRTAIIIRYRVRGLVGVKQVSTIGDLADGIAVGLVHGDDTGVGYGGAANGRG